MSLFHEVTLLPDDPILALPALFGADNRPFKVNLGIGAYKTAEGVPFVLSSVKKAEAQLLQENLNKEYLPIEGDKEFLKSSLELIFGANSSVLSTSNYFATQTVGGSGALRVAAEFFNRNTFKNIFVSNPSWPNHTLIFERAGLNVNSYPYLDSQTYLLDFNRMVEAIKTMPSASVIVLHGCCHNPTGLDLTSAQWQELSEIIKKQQLIPLFDLAYQGFGQSLEQDAWPIRHFAEQGHEMLICYSFSKNFGLYGERIGFLTILTSESQLLFPIASQIKTIIRSQYSTPPIHGANIVKTILKSSSLRLEWENELQSMRQRIYEMRQALVRELENQTKDHRFAYMYQQQGLFSLLGLTPEQVALLRQEWAIYMPSNGRINIAGLNRKNLDYVAKSLLSVL